MALIHLESALRLKFITVRMKYGIRNEYLSIADISRDSPSKRRSTSNYLPASSLNISFHLLLLRRCPTHLTGGWPWSNGEDLLHLFAFIIIKKWFILLALTSLLNTHRLLYLFTIPFHYRLLPLLSSLALQSHCQSVQHLWLFRYIY